jgi:phage tail sheath gpL-like
MANRLYDKYREVALGTGTRIDLSADNIKVSLHSSTYVPNTATDQFHNIATGLVATSGNLASKTITSGTFNAANITFTAVSGSAVTQAVIYKDTGTDSTSPLIALIDTATGLPVTPNGGDITIAWDSGTNKIFVL